MAWYPLDHGDKSLIQEVNIVISGSTNSAHIKSNADIFDFSLTDEEMAEIAKVNKNERYYIPDDAKEEAYASMEMDFDDQK